MLDTKNLYVVTLINFWGQKQYFEQRKRQQQQQTTGSESYVDGMNAFGEHHKEQRSLDILSFLMLCNKIIVYSYILSLYIMQ